VTQMAIKCKNWRTQAPSKGARKLLTLNYLGEGKEIDGLCWGRKKVTEDVKEFLDPALRGQGRRRKVDKRKHRGWGKEKENDSNVVVGQRHVYYVRKLREREEKTIGETSSAKPECSYGFPRGGDGRK